MKKFADTFKGDVIKIDGVCYEFAGYEEVPAVDVVGDVNSFSTCEECEQQSSAIDQQSSAIDQQSSAIDQQSSAIDQSSAVSSAAGFTPSLVCPDPSEPGTVAGPSVVLSVSGPSGTIDWCGKTWNLPGDNGLPQEVCPSSYLYLSAYTYPYGPPSPAQAGLYEKWHHALSGSLYLLNRVDSLGPFGNGYAQQRVRMKPPTAVQEKRDRGQQWVVGSPRSNRYYYYTPADNVVGGMTVGQTAAFLKWSLDNGGGPLIREEQFGLHTHSVNGITYTWDRGLGWPS